MTFRSLSTEFRHNFDYGLDAATSAIVQSLADKFGEAFVLRHLSHFIQLSRDEFWGKESGVGDRLDTGKFCVDEASGALRPSVERVSERIRSAMLPSAAQRWRFRRCQADRNFWLSVAAVAEPKESRFERFADCGQSWRVEYSPSQQRTRIQVKTCGNRFCPACNERLGRERMEILERPLRGRNHLKFVTLTLQHTDQPLRDQLKHLRSSFRRLRQQAIWRMSHGIAVIECKLTGSNEWHPHLHIICSGPYLSNQDLSDAWRIASKGSYIVKIKAVRNTAESLKYVTKYCCKPCRNIDNLREHPARAVELYTALQRAKMSWHFGDKALWAPPAKPDAQADPNDWKTLMTWRDCLERIRHNDARAIDTLNALGVCPQELLEAADP